MRRGRTLILILLIVIIGLAVGFFALRQFLAAPTQQEQPTTIDVYIAGQNIPQGGKITEEALTTITLPQDKVVAVMYTTTEKAALLTNKVARFPLDQGVVITESMVSDASAAIAISGPQWASLIPPGMAAMSIPAARLSLSAYAINDGAHVNINGCFLFSDVDPTFQTLLPNHTTTLTGTGFLPDTLAQLALAQGGDSGPQGRLELDPSLQQPYYLLPSELVQRPRMVCQMLLQDVVVMKLGNFSLTPASAAAQQAAPEQQAAQEQQQQQAPTKPDIVTLIVSPQDSITLTYLMYTNAQLTMTLRNPSDLARQATEASTLQFLLSQYNIPVPAKLPYSMEPRVDFLFLPILINDIPTPEK